MIASLRHLAALHKTYINVSLPSMHLLCEPWAQLEEWFFGMPGPFRQCLQKNGDKLYGSIDKKYIYYEIELPTFILIYVERQQEISMWESWNLLVPSVD